MIHTKLKTILVILSLFLSSALVRAEDPPASDTPDQFSEETLRGAYQVMDDEFLKIADDDKVQLLDPATNTRLKVMRDLNPADFDEIVKGSAGDQNVPYVMVFRPGTDVMTWKVGLNNERFITDVKIFRMRTLEQADAQLGEWRNSASVDGSLKDHGTQRGEKGHLYVGGSEFGTGFPDVPINELMAQPEITVLWRWGNWVIEFHVKDIWVESLTDAEKKQWNEGIRDAILHSDRIKASYAARLQKLLAEIDRIASRFESVARFAEDALGARPTLRLDRESVPRGANIRVTGIGFTRGAHVQIFLDGKEFFTITEATRGGGFEDWVWIPDNIETGVHEIWAESGTKRDPSKKIKLEVFEMRHAQLIDNLDKVIDLYQQAMPRNPRWAKGWANNAVDAAKTVASLPSAVYALGTGEQVKMEFAETAYVCSSYQATSLEFLNNIKWNKDPQTRALMDGLDYAPFVSGLLDVKALCHYFVVVWPHGPALVPLEKSVTFKGEPSWGNSGLAFDPWPFQRPAVIQLKDDTGQWAKSSTNSSQWTTLFSYSYTAARPESKWYFGGKYPATGGDYYYNPHRTRDAGSISIPAWGLGEEAAQSLSVRSPVRLEIRDAQGRTTGALADGRQAIEIAGAGVISIPKPASEGSGQTWFAVLPDGEFEVKIIATADGEFELLTKQKARAVQGYPRVKIKRGDVATITLNNASDRPPALRTADGKELLPKEALTPALDPERHRELESTPPVLVGATFLIEDIEAIRGEVVWIPIILRGATGRLADANIELTFDAQVFKSDGSIQVGDALGTGALIQSNTQEAGKIRLAFASHKGIESDGTILLVPLRALANPGAPTRLSLSITLAHDAQGRHLAPLAQNALVTIVDGSTQP